MCVVPPNTDSPIIDAVLGALKGQSVDLSSGEVLVVGSDKPGLVKEDQTVRLIPTDSHNRFASDKRNIGMQAAHGKILIFLDDDCIPQKNWLEHHLKRHELGEKVVGGAVDFSSFNYFQLSDNLSAFHDLMPFTKPGARPYLAAANLSVHRSVVQDIGEMEAHHNRAEDLEWTVRMRAHGYILYFEPKALILHDPARRSLSSVWRHWTGDAPNTLRVRLKYAWLLKTPRLASKRSAYIWGAPAIAAWATIRTFSYKQALLRFWFTLPLVYLTKLAWCWSAYQNFPSSQPTHSQ